MDNIDQEYFIFNYLEGNLSKSEHELCEELIELDTDFKTKVDQSRSSYFLKNRPIEVLRNKQKFTPKRTWPYWITGAIVLAFSIYHYSSINTLLIKTEQLEQELEQSQLQEYKPVEQVLISDKELDIEQPKATSLNQPSSPIKKLKSIIKYHEQNSFPNNPTPLVKEIDSTSLVSIEEIDTIKLETIDSVNKIDPPDTLSLITKDTVPELVESKDSKKKKKKKNKMNGVKTLYKHQTVVPME